MKPHDTADYLLMISEHLGTFRQVLANVDARHFATPWSARYRDRVFKRSVKILEVLKREHAKVYDDLQFLDSNASLWMFLYIQSSTPVKECVRLITRLVAQKARGAAKIRRQPDPRWLTFGYDWRRFA